MTKVRPRPALSFKSALASKPAPKWKFHSNCSGVGKSVASGLRRPSHRRYKTALVAYSQLSSIYLRSCYFNQSKMDKVHAALRWILADGAGALVLQRSTMESRATKSSAIRQSVGAGRPAGMTPRRCGRPYEAGHQIPELYNDGRHHLWQDFSAVNDNAAPLLLQGPATSPSR